MKPQILRRSSLGREGKSVKLVVIFGRDSMIFGRDSMVGVVGDTS